MDESIEAVKLYDKLSQVYDDYFSENADHLDEFLALVPKGGKILDVGCGTGKDTGYMASKGFEIIGVDLSEGMLAKAKAKYPDLDLRLEDMRKLDFPKNNFDGILVAYAIFYIPKRDVLPTLKMLNCFLKKGGPTLFVIQEGKSEELFIPEPLMDGEMLFVNVYSEEEFVELLKQAGFSVKRKYVRAPEAEGELEYNKMTIIAEKVSENL